MEPEFLTKINLSEIKENDCLVFRFDENNLPSEEIMDLLSDFRNHKLNKKVCLLLIPKTMEIELIPEEKMKNLGWKRES